MLVIAQIGSAFDIKASLSWVGQAISNLAQTSEFWANNWVWAWVWLGDDTTISGHKCQWANPQIDGLRRPPRYIALIGTFRCTVVIREFECSHSVGTWGKGPNKSGLFWLLVLTFRRHSSLWSLMRPNEIRGRNANICNLETGHCLIWDGKNHHKFYSYVWDGSAGKQTTHMLQLPLDNQQVRNAGEKCRNGIARMLLGCWLWYSIERCILDNVFCNWSVGQSASEKCWLAMVCCRKWGSGEPAIATLFIVIGTIIISIISMQLHSF